MVSSPTNKAAGLGTRRRKSDDPLRGITGLCFPDSGGVVEAEDGGSNGISLFFVSVRSGVVFLTEAVDSLLMLSLLIDITSSSESATDDTSKLREVPAPEVSTSLGRTSA